MFPLNRYSFEATGGGSSNWWEGAIAAYQPKGASSLLDSYTNLANPGTYDAYPGVAPTWNATDGWIFNTSPYLNTGLTTPTTQTWSAFCRFSNVVGTLNPLIGAPFSSSGNWFALSGNWNTGKALFGVGEIFQDSVAYISGVMAFSGQACYRDGSLVGSIALSAISSNPIYIGRNGGAPRLCNGYIQAVAIYDTTLDAPTVATVSAAMALL